MTSVIIDTRNTSALVLVKRDEIDPNQLDLFADAADDFYRRVVHTANRINGPFFFSELRALCPIGSPSAKWWGAATKKLKAAGYRMTGKMRKSPTGTRKGGWDFQWERPQ